MNVKGITQGIRRANPIRKAGRKAFRLIDTTTVLLKHFFGIRKNASVPFIDQIETQKNLQIIRLCGDIDMSTIPGIERMILEAKKNRGLMEKNLLLDFKKVRHVDSATIAALIVMLSDLKNRKHKLALVDAPARLEKMLTILECRELFSIYKSEKKALNELTI